MLFAALFLLLVLIFALPLYLADALAPRLDDTLSHWHATLPSMGVSLADFYEDTADAIKRAAIPGAVVKLVELHEGPLPTHTRPYIRVRRGEHDFYIFAAPIGDSFYVSSWLTKPRPLFIRALLFIPVIGWIVGLCMRFFERQTFYSYDSALHFNESVHAIVLGVVDSLAADSAPALTPEQRKPVMRELYAPVKATPRLAL